ncbi:MAG: SDR family NAD(P)-dependent oxidoreductase, partial [Alphaproteobacteria bacterium]
MKNPMSLAGRNILVTGAGQGIGAAIVRLAHDLGAQVIALDIKEDGIAALKDELGERIDTLVGSTADPDFVQSAVDETVARHGALHGLVNNAGIVRAAMIAKMDRKTWQDVIDVNLSGVFYGLQAAGRH